MRLARKLTLGVLGLVVPPAGAAALVVLVLHRRGLLDEAPALLATGLAGLVATLLYVAVAAHRFGRPVVRAVEQLQQGTELVITVNPDHRLDVRTGDELQALAREINALAAQLRVDRRGVEERLTAATRDLDTERRRLAGVLGELAEGVVVASADGRIALANRAAAVLLSDGHTLLGRPLGDLVDRGTIDRHLGASRAGGAKRFTLPIVRGGTLEAAMTMLPDDRNPAASGIILALRDPGPEVGQARPLAGAGLHSGSAPGVPGPIRSELHDLSLFDEMAASVTPTERERSLDELTFVVLDSETTGLRPESGDRVISLAAVRVRGGQVKRGEVFDALVHPGRAIPEESVRFHGITDAMVATAPAMEVVLPAFLAFVSDAVLVGHEVSFDLRFLAPEARRLGLPGLTTRPVLDTRLLSRSLHGPGEPHSLEAVALRLGVPVTARHSALGDALTTAEIFVRLLVLFRKRGVLTLGAALDAVRGARRVVV
ncbi:MAG TPA: exonuclease domain-containing protein [Methylomirabilota bacterium]|nr:exonuclease domain-containing protein [Methylomirabilota bacterium]